MPGEHASPLPRGSLLPPFHRTRNRNRSCTSLGHFSFPICFSTFLSLSRSSCSPSPAVSTGTGWKQGSNRSDRVNHLLMSSVPGVGGKALPRSSCPGRAANLALGKLGLPLLRGFAAKRQLCSRISRGCTQRANRESHEQFLHREVTSPRAGDQCAGKRQVTTGKHGTCRDRVLPRPAISEAHTIRFLRAAPKSLPARFCSWQILWLLLTWTVESNTWDLEICAKQHPPVPDLWAQVWKQSFAPQKLPHHTH